VTLPRHIIVICPRCQQRLRIPNLEGKTFKITCTFCRKQFEFNNKGTPSVSGRNTVGTNTRNSGYQSDKTSSFGTYCLFVITLSLISITPLLASHIINSVHRNYYNKLQKQSQRYQSEIETIKKNHESDLAAIDPLLLHASAIQEYSDNWFRRQQFDPHYALSDRERALVKMRSLSQDKTKTVEQIIRDIAIESAPADSRIKVTRDDTGLRLDVDFPMSSVTEGENGIVTKHLTIASLKRETLELISRVTYDMFQFCGELDLSTIYVGCRHMVQVEDDLGRTYSKDYILYKVRLNRKDIVALKSNPFLNEYSTRDYFEIELDEFDKIKIVER